MESFNALFYKRIGWSGQEEEAVSFEQLNDVLEQMSRTIPFENLRIMSRSTMDITKENLTHKIAVLGEGGLCYELNPLLYFFLTENGFHAELVKGTVYNHADQQFSNSRGTHAAIVLTYEDQAYIIDTGFGGSIPLKPVPFNGETVASSNGAFRIRPHDGDHGNYVLEMKLKHRDKDWRIGYAFDTMKPIHNITKGMNEIQSTIIENPNSSFNKNPIITMLTESGNITLTDTSFTIRQQDQIIKKEIDQTQFEEMKKQHFGL